MTTENAKRAVTSTLDHIDALKQSMTNEEYQAFLDSLLDDLEVRYGKVSEELEKEQQG